MTAPGRRHRDLSRQQSVLILSHDAVAAALMGALVETLGHSVRFPQPREAPEESVRRVRPRICLIDCDDPRSCQAEFLARAMMRGVSVVIFGRANALERVRVMAMAHDVKTLTLPPELEALETLILEQADPDEA